MEVNTPMAIALATRSARAPAKPAAALVAGIAGARLPSYVSPEQARAIINAAQTTRDRLLLECFWQTGGRVSEVLRLRPCDVHRQQHLGHARIDTTTIYTKLTNPERRSYADRVEW
jgi:site-specific recombinase XerD